LADKKFPAVLTIFGPTAVGKTSVAIEVAERVGGEIVSCDSRQIFKYLDIGTAKPTAEEMARARFHLVDIIPPNRFLNAYQYRQMASDAINDILLRGKRPIMTVGTGLYLKAMMDGIFEAPVIDEEIRSELEERADSKGLDSLHHELEKLDPESAFAISENDRVRIIRALELYKLTGKKRSDLHNERQLDPLPFRFVCVGLALDRDALYARIDRRCDQMIADGLVEEAKSLREGHVLSDAVAEKIVGYNEAFRYLDGLYDMDKMGEKFKQATRNYAKRQMTWFRKHPGSAALDVGDNALVDSILRALKSE
jgi:tRNA dimethylallyltransferase